MGSEDGWMIVYDKNTGLTINRGINPKHPSHPTPVRSDIF